MCKEEKKERNEGDSISEKYPKGLPERKGLSDELKLAGENSGRLMGRSGNTRINRKGEPVGVKNGLR